MAVNSTPWTTGSIAPLFVEGYSSQLSYVAGDTVDLHISTSAPSFSIVVERIGVVREQVLAESELPGSQHPVPEKCASDGCGWPSTHSFVLPEKWRSGFYEVTMRVEDNGGTFTHRGKRTAESVLSFVVRSSQPGHNTKILLQLSTNSWGAYNNYGGFSVYGFHGINGVQGHRASFDRPMGTGLYYSWEHHFVTWAEKNGYVIDYACNSDLEERPDLLESYALVLSVGHDEYWSAGMRDGLESWIARGGHAAFFSGNAVCWQTRTEDNGRAFTCWKQWYNSDPAFQGSGAGTGFGADGSKFTSPDNAAITTLWSHHLVGRPENHLTGVGFLWGGYHKSHGQLMDGSGAYTVHRPDHWVFDGCKLSAGDEFGGDHTVVGYECDGCEFVLDTDGLPVPTHRDGTPANFEILGSAPAIWAPGDSWWYEKWDKDRIGACTMGVHGGEGGAGIVFTAASTDWAHGLVGPNGVHDATGEPDPVVVQITKNVLKMLGGAVEAPAPERGRL